MIVIAQVEIRGYWVCGSLAAEAPHKHFSGRIFFI